MTTKKIRLYIYIYTLCLLFFCAGSSPLNNYVSTDPSVFYTIGRSMSNHLVPYVDIVDHKGIYLYFLNYIAAIIFKGNQTGVFFLEIIFSSFIGAVVFDIATNYLSNNRSFFVSVIFLLLYFNYFTYQGGNTIDNYTSFLILLSLLLIIKKGIKKEVCFTIGIIVAFVSQTRITNILPFCGLALSLLVNKNENKVSCVAFGLLGVIVGILPAIIYCVINNCFDEMIFWTITFNISYATGSKISFVTKIARTIFNLKYILLVIAGISSCIIAKQKLSKDFSTVFILDFALAIMSISISEYVLGYYFQILIPFTMPLLIYVASILKFTKTKLEKHKKIIYLGVFILTLIFNLRYPITLFASNKSKIYVKHAEYLNEYLKTNYSEKPMIIVTGNNALYYNKTNTIPHIKHFAAPAIPYNSYSLSHDEQAEDILSMENDIVVVFSKNGKIFENETYNKKTMDLLSDNYVVIDQAEKLDLKIYEKIQ